MNLRDSVRTRRWTSALMAMPLALGLASCGSSEGSAGDMQEIQFASYVPDSSLHSAAIQAWAEEVENETDSSVDVNFYFGETLLKATEILGGVGDGRADMGYMSPGYNPAEMPLLSAAGIPFISDNPEAVARAINEMYESNDALREEFQRNGVHLISVAPLPANVVLANKPIDDLSDFDGARARVIGYMTQAFSAVGAEPVAIGAPEQYEALQQGVLDMASGMTLPTAADSRLQEVVNHIVDPGMGTYALTMYVMNLDRWNGLDDDQKQVFEDATDKMLNDLVQDMAETETKACAAFKDAGVTVSLLPEEAVAEWRDLTFDAMVEEWNKAVRDAGIEDPAEFFDEYLSTVEKYEGESDYVSGMIECAK